MNLVYASILLCPSASNAHVWQHTIAHKLFYSISCRVLLLTWTAVWWVTNILWSPCRWLGWRLLRRFDCATIAISVYGESLHATGHIKVVSIHEHRDKVPIAPLSETCRSYMRNTGQVTEGYDISRGHGKNQIGIDQQVWSISLVYP
jgi:hypothetical protein